MDALMLLCDYADEAGGKLYIMGGGWSRLLRPNIPTQMGLAIKIEVPWDQTNMPHKVSIRLLSEDGHVVSLNDQPVQVEANLEVGRPPGLRRGTALDAPLAINFPGVALAPGAYAWDLTIDDEPVTRASFSVSDEVGG